MAVNKWWDSSESMTDSKETLNVGAVEISMTHSAGRLIGIDVARSLAIGGMALVHFVMVLSAANMDESVFTWLFNRLSGRPATVFMILAGIGVSLRFVNVTDEETKTKRLRGLWMRGWFFLAVGFLNLALWPSFF